MADRRETSTHTDQYPVQDRAHQDVTEPVHVPCLHVLVHRQEDEEEGGGIAQVVMEGEGEEAQVIAATAVMTIAAEAEVVAEEDAADVRS